MQRWVAQEMDSPLRPMSSAWHWLERARYGASYGVLGFLRSCPSPEESTQTCRLEHLLGRACRAGTQTAEARPELLLHCTAELLCSRWTSDAGHRPALQAGETAQQLALPGLHHWCTAVLSAASRGPAGGVLCTAHLAGPSLPACRGLSLDHARYGWLLGHRQKPLYRACTACAVQTIRF